MGSVADKEKNGAATIVLKWVGVATASAAATAALLWKVLQPRGRNIPTPDDE